MCGIAGILSFSNIPSNHNTTIKKMTCVMEHRGPDAESSFVEGEIALGHRRLSIIDLSDAANQPFIDNSGRYVMVFNGELYNFNEVKPLLTGYDFKTNSDTEVLLAAFIKWGVECLSYFKGMFAFAVWDREEKQLTLVRDRLGVKPIYYFQDENQFIFSSEIRSILSTGLVDRKISTAGLLEYFSFQSIGAPLSAIEDIKQIKAGTYVTIKGGIINHVLYWNIAAPATEFDFNDKELCKNKIKHLLTRSVEQRLVSDVPVGAFLSGGIDSSAVVGLMADVSSAKPATFTIAFGEKEFNESAYAAIVAKKFNTQHTNITLQPEAMLEELENALNAMDTPSGDGINTYVVSKAIRHAGVTVALSGIGGDELFAGYPFFTTYQRLQSKTTYFKNTGAVRRFVSSLIPGGSTGRRHRIKQLLSMDSPTIENAYPIFRQILSPSLLKQLTYLPYAHETILKSELKERKGLIDQLPLLSQVSVAEYIGYTQNTLLKDTDQMSMAVSLEVREPFFDHELIEFVLAIPDSVKQPTYAKSLLVESLKPLLPDEIVHRKKQGFLFPWQLWMKNELKTFCELRIKLLSQRSFINEKALLEYWSRFLKNDPSVRWAELWLFIVLEYWMEKNSISE